MALSGLSCGDFMRQKWRLYESNDSYCPYHETGGRDCGLGTRLSESNHIRDGDEYRTRGNNQVDGTAGSDTGPCAWTLADNYPDGDCATRGCADRPDCEPRGGDCRLGTRLALTDYMRHSNGSWPQRQH